MASLEAQIPRVRSRGDVLANSGVASPCDINPPQIATIPATVATEIFNADELLGRELLLLIIQNLGTTPLFYAIDQGVCSDVQFHGVLAGGVAAKDGLGSLVSIQVKPTNDVYVYAAADCIISVIKAFDQRH